MRLKNKVAIVTGGAHGIGAAYVKGFAKEGAKVVVADIDLEAANELAQQVARNGGDAFAIKVDVSDVQGTNGMVRETVERFEKVDILLTNAAMFSRVPITQAPFYELDLREWDRTFEVNVKGVLLCCRAVLPYMKTQGGGKIITVSSGQFFRGGTRYGSWAHYVSSKGAVIGLTRAMARELGDFNINVNCISPGGTVSDPNNPSEVEQRGKPVARRSIKRLEYPEDLVGTAIFLASSDSDFITGQTIVVDGGDIMH